MNTDLITFPMTKIVQVTGEEKHEFLYLVR